MALVPLSAGLQSFPPLPTIKLGPSGADFPSGWACVCTRTLWVSPPNSPVRLGVSPAVASTPQVFSISGLRLCFPEPGWWSASRSSWFFYAQMWGMGSASDHATTPFVQQSARFCVQPGNRSPVYPSCPSPPLLPVWMNVSPLSPWLSNFPAV